MKLQKWLLQGQLAEPTLGHLVPVEPPKPLNALAIPAWLAPSSVRQALLSPAKEGHAAPERPGGRRQSVVRHWKACQPANLLEVLAKLREILVGKLAVRLHTGEPHGPSLIPPVWGKDLVGKLPNSTAVSCNVLCSSPRKTAGGRCKALEAKGWGIPVDIMDAKGDDLLPVAKGVHRQEAAVGTSLSGCGSLLILTLQGPCHG